MTNPPPIPTSLLLPGSTARTSPKPAHNRLSDSIDDWTRTALAKIAPGETVTWDTSMQLAPTQNGPAPVQPVYAFLIQIPAPVLGQQMSLMAMVPAEAATAENIENTLRNALETLRSGRSQMLADASPLTQNSIR